MSPPCILLSLPVDVLLEILAHVLVDTPRSLHRTAVVRTCQLLHELGTPLLYRVVDITSPCSLDVAVSHWTALFGLDGLLTLGHAEGSFVRELRLGGQSKDEWSQWQADEARYEGFQVGRLTLSRCSTVHLNHNELLFRHDILAVHVLPQLVAVVELSILMTSEYSVFLFPTNTYGESLSTVITLPAASVERVRKVTFISTVWNDEFHHQVGSDQYERRLSLWDWPLEVLVIDLRDSKTHRNTHRNVDVLVNPLAECPGYEDAGWFLRKARRIELRVVPQLEQFIRAETKKYEQAGLSAIQKRILPLIVFLDDDGTERRLIEQTTEVATA